jgi:hypothetical protein
MTKKMAIRWQLRQVMATRGMFQTTDLVPLLAEGGCICPASRSTAWSPAPRSG